jgi:hypothetical protein
MATIKFRTRTCDEHVMVTATTVHDWQGEHMQVATTRTPVVVPTAEHLVPVGPPACKGDPG